MALLTVGDVVTDALVGQTKDVAARKPAINLVFHEVTLLAVDKAKSVFVFAICAVLDSVALQPRWEAFVIGALEFGLDAAVDALRRFVLTRRCRRRLRRWRRGKAAGFVLAFNAVSREVASPMLRYALL